MQSLNLKLPLYSLKPCPNVPLENKKIIVSCFRVAQCLIVLFNKCISEDELYRLLNGTLNTFDLFFSGLFSQLDSPCSEHHEPYGRYVLGIGEHIVKHETHEHRTLRWLPHRRREVSNITNIITDTVHSWKITLKHTRIYAFTLSVSLNVLNVLTATSLKVKIKILNIQIGEDNKILKKLSG